jgi:hypothetical protein
MKSLASSGNAKLSPLKNPFSKNKITSINMEYRIELFGDQWLWKATIRFSNGNTTGTQTFKKFDSEDYNSFETITKEIQEFIDSLE